MAQECLAFYLNPRLLPQPSPSSSNISLFLKHLPLPRPLPRPLPLPLPHTPFHLYFGQEFSAKIPSSFDTLPPSPHAIVNQTFNFICSSQTGIGKTLPHLISLITLSLPYQHYKPFPHNPWSNLRPQRLPGNIKCAARLGTYHLLPYYYCHTTYCHTTKNDQEFHFDSATYLSSFPLIIDVVEQGLTARFLTQTAIRTLDSILHQKIHRKLYVPDDFPLASPGVPPASKPTNSQPKTGHRLDQSKTNHTRKRQFYCKILILYFILATAARVPTSTQKSALLDVAYDKRRDCVARPLPYPSYFNISLSPLPRCSIPHELQLSAHPSFVNEPSPTVDYIFRLLALSYRSTTCQIPHRKTILWFK